MKKIAPLFAALFAWGCSTAPEMIPDNTTDSVILLKLKHEILDGDKISQNWGWILWYLPVLFLVVAWAWKVFIAKRCDEEEDTKTPPTPTTPAAPTQDTPPAP